MQSHDGFLWVPCLCPAQRSLRSSVVVMLRHGRPWIPTSHSCLPLCDSWRRVYSHHMDVADMSQWYLDGKLGSRRWRSTALPSWLCHNTGTVPPEHQGRRDLCLTGASLLLKFSKGLLVLAFSGGRAMSQIHTTSDHELLAPGPLTMHKYLL